MSDTKYVNYNSTANDLETGIDNNILLNPFSNSIIRRGFIKKVYSLLTLQLLFTTAMSALFIFNDTLNSFSKSEPGQALLWISIVGMLGCIIGPMCCCQNAYRKYPGNYLLLSVFTLCTSYMVAVTTTIYDQHAVLYAFITTVVVTITLTIYAMQTKYDFTTWGGGLLSCLMCLIVLGIINIFVQNQFLQTLIAAGGALIFSMYIIYDTQMIVGGNHKYQFDVDDYVFATITLYLDIINLFLYLLELFDRRN